MDVVCPVVMGLVIFVVFVVIPIALGHYIHEMGRDKDKDKPGRSSSCPTTFR